MAILSFEEIRQHGAPVDHFFVCFDAEDDPMTAATAPGPEKLYIAVIGDLVSSRALEDRAEVQEKLAATMEALNGLFADQIASRFLVTLGDEFQGLLHLGAKLSDLWFEYQDLMREHAETRLGFGLGTLATELHDEALGMDGPCFHAARAAIQQAHDHERRMAFVVNREPELNLVFECVAPLLDRTLRDWSAVQWETALLLHRLGSNTDVAQARGVKKQSVGDVLRSGRIPEALASWRAIDQLILTIGQNSSFFEGQTHASV